MTRFFLILNMFILLLGFNNRNSENAAIIMSPFIGLPAAFVGVGGLVTAIPGFLICKKYGKKGRCGRNSNYDARYGSLGDILINIGGGLILLNEESPSLIEVLLKKFPNIPYDLLLKTSILIENKTHDQNASNLDYSENISVSLSENEFNQIFNSFDDIKYASEIKELKNILIF